MAISWSYRPRKRERVIFLVWALLLLATVIKIAAQRVSTDFEKVNTEISLREARLVKLTRLMRQSSQITAEYGRIMKNEKTKDSGTLIREIENTARKAGVNLINLKPFQLKEQNLPETQALKVEVQDSLPSIVRFFSLMNDELSGIGIERVQIVIPRQDEAPRAAFMITAVPGG